MFFFNSVKKITLLKHLKYEKIICEKKKMK